MAAARFCRCLCNGRDQDVASDHPTLPVGEPVHDEAVVRDSSVQYVVSDKQPSNPVAYNGSFSQPLRGVPIREGSIWLLGVENDCVAEITKVALSLYVNGLSFVYRDRECSFSLSPFTLVRPCRFFDDEKGLSVSSYKCFKVALFALGVLLYFAVGGKEEKEAEEERQRWAVDISCTVQLVTQSLFPPYEVSCDPIEDVPQTERRLMAGYLIFAPTPQTAVLLFCELQPQNEGKARLALYDSIACGALVRDIFITEQSSCVEKVGLNCSCFSIGEHAFAARTPEERRLWLRVISNVKAKLRNKAPSPTAIELRQYRCAIKEHLLLSVGCGPAQEEGGEPLLLRLGPQVSSAWSNGLSIMDLGAPAPPRLRLQF